MKQAAAISAWREKINNLPEILPKNWLTIEISGKIVTRGLRAGIKNAISTGIKMIARRCRWSTQAVEKSHGKFTQNCNRVYYTEEREEGRLNFRAIVSPVPAFFAATIFIAFSF